MDDPPLDRRVPPPVSGGRTMAEVGDAFPGEVRGAPDRTVELSFGPTRADAYRW